jgi:hypothetical protein
MGGSLKYSIYLFIKEGDTIILWDGWFFEIIYISIYERRRYKDFMEWGFFEIIYMSIFKEGDTRILWDGGSLK